MDYIVVKRFIKKRSSFRVPAGFFAGFLFIVFAKPTLISLIAGSLIILFGEAIRIIAAGTLIKAKELTTHGIYGYIRNPLYLGSFVLGLGAVIVSRSLIFGLVRLVMVAIFGLRGNAPGTVSCWSGTSFPARYPGQHGGAFTRVGSEFYIPANFTGSIMDVRQSVTEGEVHLAQIETPAIVGYFEQHAIHRSPQVHFCAFR